MISDYWTTKHVEGNGRGLIWSSKAAIFSGGLQIDMKTLSQNSWSPGPKFNAGFLKQEAGETLAQLWHILSAKFRTYGYQKYIYLLSTNGDWDTDILLKSSSTTRAKSHSDRVSMLGLGL
jgi:hypothetical protein